MKIPKLIREYDLTYKDIPEEKDERVHLLLENVRRVTLDAIKKEIDRISSIKWLTREYVFYIVPKATPRPRSTTLKNGKTLFYVKGASDHKQFLEYYLNDEDNTLISTPVKFESKIYQPIPKSMSKVDTVLAELGLIRPITKPDWDNLAKTYCDMIQGLLIKDDRLIVDGSLQKYYSIKPRVEVRLSYMESYDSNFTRKKIER